MVMVKGEQNHRKTINANGSRRKKPLYHIAPKKWPLFTSNYHHQKNGDTRKTLFLTSKKEDQVAWIGVRGGGLGDSGNARKKTFFSMDVFLYDNNQPPILCFKHHGEYCTGNDLTGADGTGSDTTGTNSTAVHWCIVGKKLDIRIQDPTFF